MAKPSAYLIKMQESRKSDMNMQREFTIQQCKDIAVFALNEAFGFGSDRAERFVRSFDDAMKTWCTLALDDDKSDKDLNYTKQKFDDRLFSILGRQYFKPWNERYKMYEDQKRRSKT